MQLNPKNCFFPRSEIEIIPFNKLLLCAALRYEVSVLKSTELANGTEVAWIGV